MLESPGVRASARADRIDDVDTCVLPSSSARQSSPGSEAARVALETVSVITPSIRACSPAARPLRTSPSRGTERSSRSSRRCRSGEHRRARGSGSERARTRERSSPVVLCPRAEPARSKRRIPGPVWVSTTTRPPRGEGARTLPHRIDGGHPSAYPVTARARGGLASRRAANSEGRQAGVRDHQQSFLGAALRPVPAKHVHRATPRRVRAGGSETRAARAHPKAVMRRPEPSRRRSPQRTGSSSRAGLGPARAVRGAPRRVIFAVSKDGPRAAHIRV